MTEGNRWLCARCKHIDEPIDVIGPTCDAFPTGMPMEIQTGQFRHTEPYPGDNGIRFEPKDTEAQ